LANLAEEVTAELERLGIPYCVIGAVALAAHGVPRGTMDFDLFALSTEVLDPAVWSRLADRTGVDVRRGDPQDPLLAVVRFTGEDAAEIVDIVVGRGGWQRGVLARATAVRIGTRELPVATAADLVLLKLYAGGPQDAWDIEQLLGACEPGVVGEVDARVEALPSDARELWARLRGSTTRGGD